MRLQPFIVLAIAALVALFGNAAEQPSADATAAPTVATPLEAQMSLASAEEPFFGCGETRCTRDAECPSTCGGCITWSGTCALFQPR